MEEITLSEKKTLLSSYLFRVVGFDSINPRVDGPGEYRMTLKITCNKMPNKTLEQVLNDAIGVRVSLLNMGVTNPRVDTFKEEVKGWYRLSGELPPNELGGFLAHRPDSIPSPPRAEPRVWQEGYGGHDLLKLSRFGLSHPYQPKDIQLDIKILPIHPTTKVMGFLGTDRKKTVHYFIKPPNKNEAISICGRLRLSQFSTHDLEDAPENGIYCCHRCEELLARRRGMNIV